MQVADQAQRDRALDPRASFIVQAPAGSGKTELLIQRFLALLARAERPESVVAITFTKKAASEMRQRVLAALERASGPEPDAEHERHTQRLARAVRERDLASGWNLAENPHRLEIRTIDSLCASLVRRMPWMSRLGPPPDIADNADALYLEAARRTLALVEDETWSEPIGRLLLHADNDFAALESRLADMLQRRDQWLRHVGAGGDRGEQRRALERALEGAVLDAIAAARESAPQAIAAELPALAAFAAANLDEGPILACAGMQMLPGSSMEDLPAWLGIAELLLRKDDKPRAKVDKRTGFPPGARGKKEQLAGVLATLDADSVFVARLAALRRVPLPRYDERQWAIVDALLTVLPLAVAQLGVVFQSRGQIDYAEVMLAALRALGSPDNPTDLALALDYRVEHLLVDEFQDTSYAQFELLEKLTAGWEPNDGRTLFLVGDPMQSIYRFREAEVGLFLRAAREGIGNVHLEPLLLTVNFRSQAGIVEWVNAVFPEAFPAVADAATGAVQFSASVSKHGPLPGKAVHVHPFLERSDTPEAERVVEIIRNAEPGSRIAVLVRARTHLPSILSMLRENGITYQAIEIDSLSELPVIQDLLALTRALLHPADRVAWLSVLRAPWCGLTLRDLHALAGDAPHATMWDLIRDEARLAGLDRAPAGRLARVRAVFEAAFAARPTGLRDLVEGAWMALGGPACAHRAGDIENARTFFDLLDELDEGCDVDLDALAERVSALFAGPDPNADGSLQVMSIHKAKGLEFDVVIVPGLGRRARPDEARLMLWSERTALAGGGLLLAPIKPAGAGSDALYEFVRDFDREKAGHELARLLYVACTRAKKRLHLLGHTTADPEGELRGPDGSSLLRLLWETVKENFDKASVPKRQNEAVEPPRQILRRLADDWRLPEPPPSVVVVPTTDVDIETESPREAVSFYWVGDTLRHIGTVVHAMLQEITREGLDRWDGARIQEARPRIEAALRSLGVCPEEMSGAAGKVEEALTRTLADERGRWILEAHAAAASEYSLSGVRDGEVVTVRVDRTFIDGRGTRWIIDFKTSSHEGVGVEAFLDAERDRYAAQMRGYRAFFARRERRDIRTALYFPLLAAWRECAAE